MTTIAEQDYIREAAADWLLRFACADDSEAQAADDSLNAQFEAWLNEDERHLPAFQQAEQLWGQLGQLKQALPQQSPEAVQLAGLLYESEEKQPKGDKPRPKLWFTLPFPRFVLPLAAVAVVVALIVPLFFYSPVFKPPATPVRFSTGVAEISQHTLSDNSNLTLGARSSVELQFTNQVRQARLQAGDAFFDVAKDVDRPFVVAVGNTQVKVVGTQFDLHRGPREIRVAVKAGAVQVQVPQQEPVLLAMGKQVVIDMSADTGNPLVVQNLNPNQVGAWRSGRMVYENVNLAEVIADVNRYSERPITLSSNALGDLRVTTAFQTNQVDKMLRTLAVVLNLDIVETPLGIVVKGALSETDD